MDARRPVSDAAGSAGWDAPAEARSRDRRSKPAAGAQTFRRQHGFRAAHHGVRRWSRLRRELPARAGHAVRGGGIDTGEVRFDENAASPSPGPQAPSPEPLVSIVIR